MSKKEIRYLPFTSVVGRLKRSREKFLGKLTIEKIEADPTLFINTNTIFIADTGELWQKTPEGDLLYFRGREYPHKLRMQEGQVIQHLDSYLIGGENATYEFRQCIPMYLFEETKD